MKFFKKIGLFIFVFLFFGLMPVALVKAEGGQTQEAPAILNADLVSPHSRWGRPIVVGLTSKDTDVYVYVDGKFSGVAKVNESKTETNNFYYQPVVPITSGEHTIFAVAKNKKTKVLSSYSVSKSISVATLVAPTVFQPNEDTKTGNPKPLISGLTKSGTRVLIYIDGVYNGKTEVTNHVSGAAGFVYKPFLNLGIGRHTYFAIAETVNGVKGEKSRVVSFNIEKKFPAPTLLKFNKAKITGLAKNNSRIRIFIDKKLKTEFKVVNHKSGTANFAYTLQQPLTNGAHVVYAVSIDERGKESIWSNVKNLNIVPVVKVVAKKGEVNKPTITKEAASESVKPATENKAGQQVNDEDVLSKILSASTSASVASGTGLIDEAKNSQSKLKLNLIIFILFLVALISWIFWVNRELIKEKQENKETPNDESGDDANKL